MSHEPPTLRDPLNHERADEKRAYTCHPDVVMTPATFRSLHPHCHLAPVEGHSETTVVYGLRCVRHDVMFIEREVHDAATTNATCPMCGQTYETPIAAVACASADQRKQHWRWVCRTHHVGASTFAGTGSAFRDMVDDLPPFLAADNLKPFITDELRQSTAPIPSKPLAITFDERMHLTISYDVLIQPASRGRKLRDLRAAVIRAMAARVGVRPEKKP